MVRQSRFLTAKEAAEILGITPTTLYTYVSRGLIRSEMISEDSRVRRYNSEDVYTLKDRKEQRKNPAKAVENALHWGTPILESALTLINDDGLYYRGQDALHLAVTLQFEQVAALLWTESRLDGEWLFSEQLLIEPPLEQIRQLGAGLSFIQKLQIGLTLGSAADLAAFALNPEKVSETGARIMQQMTAILADYNPQGALMASALHKAWAADHPKADRLLNTALILCADHELNVSSFTARVVASAESNPYAVVQAGLAAMQGVLHGGNIERVEVLLREIGNPEHVQETIAEKLRRGELIPGFGHKLYPDGDPRCKLLLSLIYEAYPDAPSVKLAKAVDETTQKIIERAPNIDFALAVMGQTLQLPRGAGLAIFALGRTVGWIGHAIEQYKIRNIIRPRAIYVGEPPQKPSSFR
jgi:citrate synthase